MNATTGEAETVVVAKRFLDVLPVRGGRRIALEWTPFDSDGPEPGGNLPLVGHVVLTGARDRTTYRVTECPDEHGRSVVMTKVEGKGTDARREWYILRCDRDGTHGRCDCQGFVKWANCKHADTLETLVANEWL